MTKTEAIEHAIMAALRDLGPSTARQIEVHGSVVKACREAKLKARHRLEMMMHAGKVKSDRVGQGSKYWV